MDRLAGGENAISFVSYTWLVEGQSAQFASWGEKWCASALPVKTLEFCELLLSNLLACSAVHLVQQAKWKVNTICSGFCLKIGKLDFHPQSQNILNFLTEICSPSDRTPLLDGHKKVDSWEIELRLLVLLYSSIPLCYFAGMPAWSILWIDWMLDTVSLS